MIEKEFTPTVSLFYKASREIFHSNMVSLAFYGFFLGLPALLLTYYVARGMSLNHVVFAEVPAWAVLAICVFYALAFMPALQYWGVRKSVLSNPSANQAQHYTVSEEGIRNHGLGVEVTLSWDKVVRIHESKSFLLFYISKYVAYFIPLNLLSPSEIEEIKQWHKSKNLNP